MSAYNVKGDLPKEKLEKRKVILDELLPEESYVMDIHTLNKIFLELQSEENAGVISGSVVRIFEISTLCCGKIPNF